jgi:hypothetical protein
MIMCRFNARELLGVALVAACLPVLAGAGPASDPEPLQVSVQKDPNSRTPPTYRVFVTRGTAKIAFLIPELFQLAQTPVAGELSMHHPDGAAITMTVVDKIPSDAAGLEALACRDKALELYPKAVITQELPRIGMLRTGQGFELSWMGTDGKAQSGQVLFLPTSAGVLVFRGACNKEKFSALQAGLRTVTGTIATTAKGELKIMPASDAI